MDRTVTLHIKRSVVNPLPSDIYRVRKWGDPVLVDLLGATTSAVGSNFQVVKTASLGNNNVPDFNDISRWQLPDPDYLYSIQRPDAYTVTQKWNWLVGDADPTPSRPYWYKNSQFRFGPFVFGGQLVQLGESVTVYDKYPGRTTDEWITMRRVIGLRRSQFYSVSFATHPHLIQHATEAWNNDVYNEFPRGEIFHPVWSDVDFPVNHGDGKMWLPTAFVV